MFFVLSSEDESKEDQDRDEDIDEGIDEGEADEDGDDNAGVLEESNENEDDGENDIPDNSDMEHDASAETADDVSEEFTGIPGVIPEIDDNSAEPLEEVRIITLILLHTNDCILMTAVLIKA